MQLRTLLDVARAIELTGHSVLSVYGYRRPSVYEAHLWINCLISATNPAFVCCVAYRRKGNRVYSDISGCYSMLLSPTVWVLGNDPSNDVITL